MASDKMLGFSYAGPVETSYEDIYKLFYDRVINDKRFFLIGVVDPAQAEEIARKRAKSLLLESIVIIMMHGNRDCDVDFITNRNDDTEVFDFVLNLAEKQLLADVMFQRYLEKDITLRLNALGTVFQDSDLTVFAPSNDVKQFSLSLTELRLNNERAIEMYKSRNRDTFAKKTFDYSFNS